MKKQTRKTGILYGFLCLILLFIWGNSLLPVQSSAAESELVGRFLTPLLELVWGRGNVTDHIVRKLAHFCEFGGLGLTLGHIMLMKGKTRLFHLSYCVFCGVTVAVIDEGIQLIAAGRGALVSDVLLDSSGVLTGVIGISVLLRIIRARRKK